MKVGARYSVTVSIRLEAEELAGLTREELGLVEIDVWEEDEDGKPIVSLLGGRHLTVADLIASIDARGKRPPEGCQIEDCSVDEAPIPTFKGEVESSAWVSDERTLNRCIPMWRSMGIERYSDEDLKNELARRKAANAAPKLLDEPDIDKLQQLAVSFMTEKAQGTGENEDNPAWAFEGIMEAFYGTRVWDWWNKQP